MKKASLVWIFLVFFTQLAYGSIINFVSGDEPGDGYLIVKHPVWDQISGASWVSGVAGSGYGGVVVPNTTVLSGVPSYSLTESIFLPHQSNVGYITVGADDTVGVHLFNTTFPAGLVLFKPNPAQDQHCAAGIGGCQPGEFVFLDLGNVLSQGENTFRFDVFQIDGDATGAIWRGVAESESVIPEPVTLFLAGSGLGILVGVGFLRSLIRKK